MVLRRYIFISIGLLAMVNLAMSSQWPVPTIEDSLLQRNALQNNPDSVLTNYQQLVNVFQIIDTAKANYYCQAGLTYAQNHQLKQWQYIFLIEQYRTNLPYHRPDSLIPLIKQLKPSVDSLKNSKVWGLYNTILGQAYQLKFDIDNALSYSFVAIKHYTLIGDTNSMAKVHQQIGIVYNLEDDHNLALEHLYKALKWASREHYPLLHASVLFNIGVVYQTMHNYQESLDYYYKALETSHRFGNTITNALLFNNIAITLHKLNRNTEAANYFSKAHQMASELKQDQILAGVLMSMAEFQLDKANPDSAYLLLNKSIALDIKQNYLPGLAQNYACLGRYFLLKKNHEKAINSFNEALQYVRKSGLQRTEVLVLNNISQAYAGIGQYHEAYTFTQSAQKLTDSLQRMEKSRNARIEGIRNDIVKRQLHQESELFMQGQAYKHEIIKERNTRYLILVVLGFMVFIAALMYRAQKKMQGINLQLLKKNNEVEQQNALIEISNTELKDQYQFTQTLLDTIPNPFFYTDQNHNLLGCNNAFEEAVGIKAETLAGINLMDINTKTHLQCEPSKLFAYKGKGLVKNEGCLFVGNSLPRDVICYRNGIVNDKGQVAVVLGIIIDITDIRDAQRSMEKSEQQLKQALDARNKFFNIMAHDLKNPFHAVLGLTDVILEQYDYFSDEQVKKYIAQLNKSASHIYSLLENILEWSRTQTGAIQVNREALSVSKIIEHCMDLFKQSIETKQMVITCENEVDASIFADRNMMMTVFRNLISNAIKFTPAKGKISVLCRQTQLFAIISITDTGIGIPKENQMKLFKEDQTVSTPGLDNEKGTGLGLLLCHELIKLNGGQMEVKSALNEGTTFTVTLPLAT